MGDNYGVQIERLELELSAARRDLAQAREEALEELLRLLAERANKYANSVEDYYLHGLWMARDIVLSLKSPAQGATSTAPQVSGNAEEMAHRAPLASPAAAVPDNPVALFCKLVTQHNVPVGLNLTTQLRTALNALARHYEARGMRKAAEIGKDAETMWGYDFSKKYGDVTCEQAILFAAAELERNGEKIA